MLECLGVHTLAQVQGFDNDMENEFIFIESQESNLTILTCDFCAYTCNSLYNKSTIIYI